MTTTSTATPTPQSQSAFAPKHILVPVDVEPNADRALAEHLVDDACAMAKRTGARLTIAYVSLPSFGPTAVPIDAMSAAYRSMLQVLEEIEASATNELSRLETRAKNLGVVAASRMVRATGRVPEAIVREAERERCDLIMLTSHGRRGVERFLLGSIAERTAHLSTIPVLLLPVPA